MEKKLETTVLLRVWGLGLEGQGDLVSRLIVGIMGVIIWLIWLVGIIDLLTTTAVPTPN